MTPFRRHSLTPSASAGIAIAAGLLLATPPADAAGREGAYEGDFWISGKEVVPDSNYVARFRILGAAITASGTYDIPVTARLRIGSAVLEPYGPFPSPTGGNVNDHDFPKDFILTEQHTGGDSFTVEAQSWIRASEDGDEDDDWVRLYRVASDEHSPNMLVLRNGDAVPDIEAFMDQDQLSHILRDYINPVTHTVAIHEDDVIYLFELGTTNLSSPAADFQDFVILVTLAEDPTYFEAPYIPPLLQYD